MKIGKVEKSVPLPSKYSKGQGSYGLHLLEVDDSRHIGLEEGEKYENVRSRISTAASVLAAQLGMGFCVKRDGKGLRVWRVR